MLSGRKLKRGLAMTAALAFSWLLSITPVMAADTVTATIPVSQTYSEKNKIPSDLNRTFNYQFKADNSSDTMPSGSSSGTYNFSLSSTASTKLSINYSKTGVYNYSLKQLIPEKKISGMNYDNRTYKITVSVKNSSSGLIAEVYINENGSSYKSDEAKFDNNYVGKKSSGSKKNNDGKKDDSGSSSSTGSSSSYASSTSGTGDSGVLGDREAPESGSGDEADSGVLGDKEGPDTGDSARPFIWIGVMAASALAMIFILLGLKKRR